MSDFKVQIITTDGSLAYTRVPGDKAEADLVEALGAKLAMVTTRAKAMKALEEVLYELKEKVRPS
jgi:hypothetical protein